MKIFLTLWLLVVVYVILRWVRGLVNTYQKTRYLKPGSLWHSDALLVGRQVRFRYLEYRENEETLVWFQTTTKPQVKMHLTLGQFLRAFNHESK